MSEEMDFHGLSRFQAFGTSHDNSIAGAQRAVDLHLVVPTWAQVYGQSLGGVAGAHMHDVARALSLDDGISWHGDHGLEIAGKDLDAHRRSYTQCAIRERDSQLHHARAFIAHRNHRAHLAAGPALPVD